MKRDVLGLRLIERGAKANPVVRRMWDQLQAADALLTIERDVDEPPAVRDTRRRAEQFLREARYEEAQEEFLAAIDLGLQADFFPWQAAVNLLNCHRFLGNLDDAEATALQLAEMYVDHPAHPIQYLLATQRGALAADRFRSDAQPAYAREALSCAESAYQWQVKNRGEADGLRAYNLLVALLRLDRRAAALEVYARHEHDDAFGDCCAQGEYAEAIAGLVAG